MPSTGQANRCGCSHSGTIDMVSSKTHRHSLAIGTSDDQKMNGNALDDDERIEFSQREMELDEEKA
jgi:hypothetical protein